MGLVNVKSFNFIGQFIISTTVLGLSTGDDVIIMHPWHSHYNDVIMGVMASQITRLTIVYSTVYSGVDQRKHQSSASLALVRGIHQWPVNSLDKGPVMRKMFPFDDVIMHVKTDVKCIWFGCVLIYFSFIEFLVNSNDQFNHVFQGDIHQPLQWTWLPWLLHDNVIKWKHFPPYWPFVRGIHWSPVNSPHKGQWRGALMFSLIWHWANSWINNQDAGDLRHHRAHHDVTVMSKSPATQWYVSKTPLLALCEEFTDSPHKWPVLQKESRVKSASATYQQNTTYLWISLDVL